MPLKKTAAPSRRHPRRTAARTAPRAVRPLLEGLEGRQLFAGTLSLSNPFALPASDRLIFSVVGNPTSQTPANVTHSQQSLTITNASATAALTINSLTLSGPFAFVGTPPAAGTSVAPGGSLTVTIAFTQASVPAHTVNETNFTTAVAGAAAIGGSLTIATSDATTPTKVVTLAGYYQQVSNNNEEPSLQTIVNRLAGYQTNIGVDDSASTTSLSSPKTTDVDLNQSETAPTYYGSEVYSPSWEAANPAVPVTVQQLAAFHTQGNTASLYWYTASNQASHGLFRSTAAQAQTILPTTTDGGTTPLIASFTPGVAFGLRVDNEYTNDAINVAKNNTGGAGHHFRFFPLVNEAGVAVPNAYVVAMDYGVVQAENFDFQDNAYVITNVRPSGTPDTPTNLTAVGGSAPSLSWTASNYAPVAYNVYRSTSAAGPFTKLTATPIAATQYQDTTLGSTATAFYRVTAVDTTQPTVAESAPASVVANAGPAVASPTYNATAGVAFAVSALNGATDSTSPIVPSSVVIVAGPNHGGTATVDTAGTITYTPAATYVGTETLEYTIADQAGERSQPGTITFNVAQPNPGGGTPTPPVVPGTLTTNPFVGEVLENKSVTLAVLSADTPATSFATTGAVTLTNATGKTSHGQAVVNADSTITYTPDSGFVGSDSFTYVAHDANGTSSGATTVSVDTGVAIGAGTPYRKLTFVEVDKTTVTVTLNRGTAQVIFDSSGNATTTVAGSTITATGSGLHIRQIGLTGTTAASTLTITGAGGGQVTLGGLHGTTLGTLNARTANLVTNSPTASSIVAPGNDFPAGSIQLAGLHSLLLRSSTNGNIILGNTGVANTSVQFAGAVAGTVLRSAAPITTLRAATWTSVSSNVQGPITAPSIATLVVPGEFDADLTLTSTARSLGTARVGGPVNDGTWNLAGGAGSITLVNVPAATSTAAGFGGLTAGGAIGTFAVTGGNLSSDVSAATINSFRVAGTMSGNLHTAGNLNTLTVGALVGSTVTVGTSASLADVTAANIGSAVLRSLRVTGRAGTVFNDSTVVAHTIDSATTGQVNAATTNPEGIAAVTFLSAAVGVNGGTLRLNRVALASNAALAGYLTGSGKTLGTFVIDIV